MVNKNILISLCAVFFTVGCDHSVSKNKNDLNLGSHTSVSGKRELHYLRNFGWDTTKLDTIMVSLPSRFQDDGDQVFKDQVNNVSRFDTLVLSGKVKAMEDSSFYEGIFTIIQSEYYAYFTTDSVLMFCVKELEFPERIVLLNESVADCCLAKAKAFFHENRKLPNPEVSEIYHYD